MHYETVSPLLKEILGVLMREPLLAQFCLVGGTNLSLWLMRNPILVACF